MAYYPGLNPLRDILASLYPTEGYARAMVTEAGIAEHFIDFHGSAFIFWQSILSIAHSNGQVENLIDVARTHFPKNEILIAAVKVFSDTPVPPQKHRNDENAKSDSGNVTINIHGDNRGLIAGGNIQDGKIIETGDVKGNNNEIGQSAEVIFPKPSSNANDVGHYTKDRIRVDVATPSPVYVGRSFDLAVAIRQVDAPPLSIKELDNLVADEGDIFRSNQEQLVRYRVEVIGANFKIEGNTSYTFQLEIDQDSKPVFFQLTPQAIGTHRIGVDAYQVSNQFSEELIAQTRLKLLTSVSTAEPFDTEQGTSEDVDLSLTNIQLKELDKAIRQTFTMAELERMLSYDMGISLDEVTMGQNRATAIFELIKWLERVGRMAEFVRVVQRNRPNNTMIQDITKSLLTSR